MGDFNCIVSQADKKGGRPMVSSSSGGMAGLMCEGGLIDLGFVDHQYTWSNKRVEAANIQERLDRGLANGEWKLLFPFAYI